MRSKKCVMPIAMLVVLGLMLVCLVDLAVFAQTEAVEMEAPKVQDVSMKQPNPVIDCSSNGAYRTGEYRDYVTAVGHQNCRSCHQSVSPAAGQGDRPSTFFASFSLQNRSDEA